MEKKTDRERFMAMVAKDQDAHPTTRSIMTGQGPLGGPDSECWRWFGARAHPGRGQPRFKANGKMMSAARWIWTQEAGREPVGDLTRTCPHDLCVNPEHWKDEKQISDELNRKLGFSAKPARVYREVHQGRERAGVMMKGEETHGR